jgi:hypothetical protein
MSNINIRTESPLTLGANVPVAGYMDAAVRETIAGVEFAVEGLNVSDSQLSRTTDSAITLGMHPATMMQMALLMLEKLGTPALNEREWRFIADALRYAASQAVPERGDFITRCREHATNIERAYTVSA